MGSKQRRPGPHRGPILKREEIKSKLTGETLVRHGLMKSTATGTPYRVTPELNVVKIGGHGIIDYGSPVVTPLVDEIGHL